MLIDEYEFVEGGAFKSGFAQAQVKMYAKLIRMSHIAAVVQSKIAIGMGHNDAIEAGARVLGSSKSTIERSYREYGIIRRLIESYTPEQVCRCVSLGHIDDWVEHITKKTPSGCNAKSL